MNERIKELVVKAGFFPSELTQVGPSVEKFAELIAAEEREACARCKDLEEQAYDLLGKLKVANLKWSVAHPWVGLTNQEVADLDSWYHADNWRLIKETEAKLKEKNT